MTDTTAGTRAGPSPAVSHRRVQLVLLGVVLALMLGMLDNMIIGTAMPTIVGELGGREHLSWVVTAYTLATAVTTPIWGKVGDLFGRRTIFLLAIVVFLLGSALSGAAQSIAELIAFRVLQGCGSGGLVVGAFAIIGDLVPPRERARYQATMATATALATIGGPLLGGVITDHAGWRWTFYINVPIGLVALVWCHFLLRLPRRRSTARVDVLGAVLLGAAITAALLVTTWGGEQYAWSSAPIVGLAVLGAAALAAFVAWQRRVAEPILPPRLFQSRNLSLASVMGLMFGAIIFGSNTYLPLYQQTVQGVSASNSGALLLPMMLGIVAVSQVTGRVITRTGRYRLIPIVGFVLITAGMVLLGTMDAATSRGAISLYMLLLGTGMGCLMQITTLLAQNSVEARDLGAASASATLFRTVGGSFGVALFGALLNSRIPAGADPSSPAYLRGFVSGSHGLFLCGAVLALAGLVAAWFITDAPLRGAGTGRLPDAPPAPADRSTEKGEAA